MADFSVWHWLVLAILLYFIYAAVRRSRTKARPGMSANDMTEREAELIVNAYGKILEHLGPMPGATVADESKLPFPKDKIKAALLLALGFTKSAEQREVLKTGYLFLADFQPHVGPRDVGIDLSDMDVAKLDDAGLQALARNFVDTKEVRDKWLAQARAEREQLEKQLRAAGM